MAGISTTGCTPGICYTETKGRVAPNTVPEVRLLALLLASALVASPVPLPPFPPELSSELNAVVERYVSASQAQRQAMYGGQMDIKIEGRLTELKEKGRMNVVGYMSKAGELTHEMVDFDGDKRIKTELMARFLELEEKTKSYGGAMEIGPKDYEFRIKAILKKSGKSTYVFEVNPRQNTVDKFRGELWIDGTTGMPLREAGKFVKNPSLWVKNLRFSRDYELRDGISVVKRFQSSTDVRILGVGTAELDVNFSNFSRTAAEQPAREERL